MTRSIVLLGGGIDSLGIIARAREMGLRTIVVDHDPSGPGLARADVPLVASCYDPDETLEMLYHERPDALLCAGTDAPHVMAAVAQAYGLVGPTQQTAELSRDKLGQALCLKAHGITTPRLAKIGEALALAPGQWAVIKPIDSRGGRGVLRFGGDLKGERLDLAPLIQESCALSPTGRAISQEWVDGVQLSTESLIQGGRILWTSFAERNYDRLEEFAPHVIEDGSDMPPAIPSYYENDYEEKTNRSLQACVEAIGLENGTLKGDVVWTGSEAVIIEVATRLSGGSFCSQMTPMCWGVDFVGMAIRIALGETIYPGEIRPYLRGHVCQRFYFPPGKMITCHPDRGPSVITRGKTREEARERARKELEAMHDK